MRGWLSPLRRRLLDRLILRPTTDTIEPAEGSLVLLRRRPGDRAGDLASHRRLIRDDDALVLKFPGNAGRAERSSHFPATAIDGVGEIWTWNPPGYGDSDGPSSLRGYAEAAREWAERVLEHLASPDRPIYLCGNSMGCCAATFVAAKWSDRQTIRGVILRNPPPLDRVVMRIAQRYPMGTLVQPIADSLPEPMRIERHLGDLDVPIVWIHSQRDSLVPEDLQRSLFESFEGPLTAVPLAGLDHNDVPDANQQRQIEAAIRSAFGVADAKRQPT